MHIKKTEPDPTFDENVLSVCFFELCEYLSQRHYYLLSKGTVARRRVVYGKSKFVVSTSREKDGPWGGRDVGDLRELGRVNTGSSERTRGGRLSD